MKTLIELFDSVQIENVVAGLRFNPQKIVFVGFKEIMTKRKIEDLRTFFANRSELIELDFELVGRYDYDAIIERLNFILDTNEDCCFDLTGGKELVIAAMGAVSLERKVPMFQLNVRTGTFIRVKNSEEIPEAKTSHLSIAEGVQLNGCAVVGTADKDKKWFINDDFKKDIEAIWNISRKNCGLWNRQSCVLGGFENFGHIYDDLSVHVNLEYLKRIRQDILIDEKIINELISNSLILDYELKNDELTFRYKNEQVHRCITKAGNILELYAYMLMQEITEEEPGYYDDLDMGVYIDWDGVIHGDYAKEKDIKNEIDIMAMRDLVPIFISCKNGEVHKEALYELSVVAQKFGGRYARKFMLSTYVSSNYESAKYIIKRANEMGIMLIDNLHLKSREEFKKLLKNRIK